MKLLIPLLALCVVSAVADRPNVTQENLPHTQHTFTTQEIIAGLSRSSSKHADHTVQSRHGEMSTTAPLNCSEEHHEPTVHLASFRWEEIGAFFTITAFVLIAGLCKLGFHHLHWLSSKVPESCLLIVLGLLMGLMIYFLTHETDPSKSCHHHVAFPTFSSEAFFLILLPPIILESAYSLHDRAFMDNIGSVIIFAVFGTILNIFFIGPSLYGLAVVGAMGPINITMTESLVFSSLISAVDPVAVLGIFQELSVNKGLYFLVFGESLFNDGVTVVLYNTLSVFLEMTTISAMEYVKAVVSFFIVAVCGSLIGIFYGILTALVTKITMEVRVMEPLALLGIAYLAYLTAELFHFSGIISLIFCGLVQAQYATKNVSQKSYTTVKYFIKMASATSETIIFMFLGMVLVSEDHAWHTGFIVWTLVLCFVVRFIITLGLSAATNKFRLHPIDMSEQLIIAYGGLRGAVAFSLVGMLPEDLELRRLFVTTTLAVVLFTVFIQGITIKPLVTWLKISRQSSANKMLIEEVHQTVVDHMMAGVEEILGNTGDASLRETLRKYNEKYFKKWLLLPSANAPLTRLFEKIAITEHYAHLYGPAVILEKQGGGGSTEDLIQEGDDLEPSSRTPSIQCLNNEGGDAGHTEVHRKRSSVHQEVELRHKPSDTAIRMDDLPHKEKPRPTSTQPVSRADDSKFLRNAFSSNPFTQLHYKFNKNLVNEDNQEISTLFQRRHCMARRINQLASGADPTLEEDPNAATQSGLSRAHPTKDDPQEGALVAPDDNIIQELQSTHQMIANRRKSMLRKKAEQERQEKGRTRTASQMSGDETDPLLKKGNEEDKTE